mgnify:CR=1 FL=1
MENNNLDLTLLEEYQKITEIEKVMKDRKEEIKKYFMEYLNQNSKTITPEYNGLIGRIEERVSYSLNPDILERELPPVVFNEIVEKNINLNKTKEQFLEGRIPVDLLQRAEEQEVKYSFYVRKNKENNSTRKSVPFWRP